MIGVWLLALCLLVESVLVGLGLFRMLRAALALKRRVEGYGDLALRVDIALAQRRIAVAQRRIDTIPALTRRADIAVTEILRARDRVIAMAGLLSRILRRPVRY